MKRDKLYTVNKWNQPLFADVDRRGRNIFDGSDGSHMQIGVPIASGYNPQFKAPDTIDLNGIIQKNAYNDYLNSSGNNWFGISKKNNPLSRVNIGTTAKAAGGAAAALGSQIGVSERNKRGMFDILDPVHQLAGGRESGIGNAFGDAGVGLFQAGASSGNPWLMAAGAAAKIVGGGINALAGIKTDKEALENAQNGIAYYNNIQGANSYDDIRGLTAQATFKNPYTGSLFRSVGSKNRDLKEQFYDAKSYAERGIENNIWNIRKDKINDYLANYSAYGGPIYTMDNNDNMSAINYGFMQDYLTNKKQEIAAKNKMAGLSSMPSFMPQNSYAIGGDLQTNGARYSVGQVIDISEAEAKRLKAMGYEFTVVE